MEVARKENGLVLVMLADGQGANAMQDTSMSRGCVQYKHIAQLVMEHASDVPLENVHVLLTTATTPMKMEDVKRILMILGEECTAKELAHTVKDVPERVEIL